MTISLRMLLTADGRQAISENTKVQRAVKQTATSIQSIGSAARVSGNDLSRYQGQIDLTAAKMTKLRTAQLGVALANREVANTNRLAAGSVGNLAAQFNDIGVMLAAGQNPLQLALQQGTQITQVIGPLGAAGAVNALRTAFVSLINPVSLITIGVIAGGAALFQWATSARKASEDSERFKTALEEIEDQTQKTTDKLALLQSGLGSVAELRVQQEINRLQAERNALLERALDADNRQSRNLRGAAAVRQEEISALDAKIEALEAAARALSEEEVRQRQITDAYQVYAATRTQSEADIRAELARQYRLYGNARAEAENTSEAVRLLEDGISRATLQAMALAGVDLTSPISSSAEAAARLAENLGIAYGEAVKLNAARNAPYVSSGRGQDPRQFDTENRFSNRFNPSAEIVAEADRLLRAPRRTARGGGGGAARQEADAVQNLTNRLQQQIDVLRATDPVQKEMIRNRETLAKASAAERAKIEELITTHQEETLLMDRKREAYDLFNSTATNVLDAIFDKTTSVKDVLKAALVDLLQFLAQSRNLNGLGGGGAGGGFFGALFGGLFPARKDGGMVYGPGGPRDDKVMVAMSNGEMAINARATARHRGLLEMINAGAPIPRLRDGGVVGGGGATLMASGPQVIEFNATVRVEGAMGNKEIETFAQRGTEAAIEEFSRKGLPDRVRQINSDPRVVG